MVEEKDPSKRVYRRVEIINSDSGQKCGMRGHIGDSGGEHQGVFGRVDILYHTFTRSAVPWPRRRLPVA